jgi:hypothetical protein
MPSGLQALLALFLLLPGFVSARIVRLLNARSQQSDLERLIQALIYSFFIYVLYLGVFGAALPIEWVQVTPPSAMRLSLVIHRWRICTLGALSLAVGCGWGLVKGRDWHMAALRRIRLTERTSRESVWNDVLLSQEGVVQVGLGDGRIALGLLDRYSDTGEEGSLFLRKASWVAEDGTITSIYGPGLLLTKSADIKFVMFLDEDLQRQVAADRVTEDL